MLKKCYLLFCLAVLLFPLSVQAQSVLFGEKATADFATKIQPELLKKAADDNTTPYDFMLICKQLGVYGDKTAAAVVARSLANPERSHSARNALEEMPFPEALAELRKAVTTVKDPLLLSGIINSLGMRQDKEAISLLLPFLKNDNALLAGSALFALARIADPSCSDTILLLLTNKSAMSDKTRDDLILMYGEFLSRANQKDLAEKVWLTLADKCASNYIKEAACYQILLRDSDNTRNMAAKWLISEDKISYRSVLRAAQFVKNDAMCQILAEAYAKVSEDRKAPVLAGLGDQCNIKAQPILMKALVSDNEEIKTAAIHALKSFADSSSLEGLVKTGIAGDATIHKASIIVITQLDSSVDFKILNLLKGSDAEKAFAVELIGARKIKEAKADIFELAKNGPALIQLVAVRTLGEIADMATFNWLVDKAIGAETNTDMAKACDYGLKAACGSVPDRTAAAKKIAAASETLKDQKEKRLQFLQLLSLLGGPSAREEIEKVAFQNDLGTMDIATQILGRWMEPEVAPVLLKLANTPNYPYAKRALSGYLRLARQFSMPVWMRRAMVRDALASPVCGPDQKKTADIIIKQYKIDMNVQETEVQKILRNIEIVRAIYGIEDPDKQKDVTAQVKKIVLNSDTTTIKVENGFNNAFDGDPAPGVSKKLYITIRNGNTGEIKELTIPENGTIKVQ